MHRRWLVSTPLLYDEVVEWVHVYREQQQLCSFSIGVIISVGIGVYIWDINHGNGQLKKKKKVKPYLIASKHLLKK